MIKGTVVLELHEVSFEIHSVELGADFARFTVKTDLGNGCYDIEAAECDASTFMQALGQALQYDPDTFPVWKSNEVVAALTKRRWVP